MRIRSNKFCSLREWNCREQKGRHSANDKCTSCVRVNDEQ